jgi:hypothetical protein
MVLLTVSPVDTSRLYQGDRGALRGRAGAAQQGQRLKRVDLGRSSILRFSGIARLPRSTAGQCQRQKLRNMPTSWGMPNGHALRGQGRGGLGRRKTKIPSWPHASAHTCPKFKALMLRDLCLVLGCTPPEIPPGFPATRRGLSSSASAMICSRASPAPIRPSCTAGLSSGRATAAISPRSPAVAPAMISPACRWVRLARISARAGSSHTTARGCRRLSPAQTPGGLVGPRRGPRRPITKLSTAHGDAANIGE